MLWRAFRYVNARASLQLRILRLGFFQDGDVGFGVFPEGEEVFVGGECSDAGSIGPTFPTPTALAGSDGTGWRFARGLRQFTSNPETQKLGVMQSSQIPT
jgi:hypothetical protein